MSYESTAEPIKVGYLMDFKLPEFFPKEMKDDFSDTFELVFGEAHEAGLIDRPIEIVYREVEGFPQGSLTDEPIFWADLLTKGGYTEVGVLVEQSLVGDTYVKNFRNAARRKN